jgi:apolipoprotein N-acyltransferase
LNFAPTSPWVRRALAILAGVLLALSFPRMNIAGFAWVAPGLMLFAARGGISFRLGYLAGITHYLVSLSWLLHIPVKFYPILGWIALAAYLALYPATWVWLCTKTRRDSTTWLERSAHALFCAAAWVALEMIVARLFSGFPWNLLGVSQHRMLPLIQIASVTGVYGVSFLVVWFSASLFHAGEAAFRSPAAKHLWLREIAAPTLVTAVVFACGLRAIASHVTEMRSINIALVQPSIPQTMIWNSADADERFHELLKLSIAAVTNKPDLLIWPEAAVPKMVRNDRDTQLAITDLARTNHLWIIIGSDDFDFRGTNAIFFNSSFLVSPDGDLVSTYRKRRLVIFGEYVPLIDWLPFIKYLTPITGGFTAGEKPVTFELGTHGPRTSVLICFEDTFPHYAREHATNDIDFLVNITNDGWFGESSAQWQHAANAAFRAVENGVPLVRCANNGVTCWIDSDGAMRDAGFDNPQDVYRAGFKIVTVPFPSARTTTFYNRHGDVFGWTCVIIVAAVVAPMLAGALKKRRHNR